MSSARVVRRHTIAGVLVVAVIALTAACSSLGRSSQSPAGAEEPQASTSPTGAPDAGSAATTAPELTPVVASVLFPPVPFEGSDGRVHLVYELGVTNFTQGSVVIHRLDIDDAASGDRVVRLGRRAVNSRLQPAGGRDSVNGLDASQTATLFVHVTLAPDAPVPTALTHVLTVTAEVAPPGANPLTERVATTPVDARTLPVLGPPLMGKDFVAADGCCDASRHTRAILPIDGKLFVAQRYAIDYEKINKNGRIYVGKRKDPSSYMIYGHKALAVADGTVVTTIDNLPEQTPGQFPENIPLDQADGNSVVIDLGDGFFANYAHLQPGSVRVQAGDRVQRGDVLGLVGNSGNSLAPHLHFHVMNGPSPLASQGLPYLVDAFGVTAQSRSTAAFDKAEADGTPLVTVPSQEGRHTDQLVLDQRIVSFAGG